MIFPKLPHLRWKDKVNFPTEVSTETTVGRVRIDIKNGTVLDLVTGNPGQLGADVPPMDFVAEHAGLLWGCKSILGRIYAMDLDTREVQMWQVKVGEPFESVLGCSHCIKFLRAGGEVITLTDAWSIQGKRYFKLSID